MQRYQTFDLLKGLAVLLMIQVHIIEKFASLTVFNSSVGKLLLFFGGPPVAPMFLIAFGFFVAKSKKSPLQHLKRGSIILLAGLLLNIGLNLHLFIKVFAGIIEVNIYEYIFGVDILINAGVSILILAFIKKLIKNKIPFLIVIMLIFAFAGTFLSQYHSDNLILKYLLPVFSGVSDWSYFPVFPWFSYTLSGYILYLVFEKYNFKGILTLNVKIFALLGFVVFLLLSFKYALNISSDLMEYYHHNIIFFIWVMVFLMFYAYFVNIIESTIGNTVILKYIKWLGKNVTLVYVIQWLIIGNVATQIYRSVDSYLLLSLSFIAVISASGLFVYLYIKRKESKLL